MDYGVINISESTKTKDKKIWSYYIKDIFRTNKIKDNLISEYRIIISYNTVVVFYHKK